MKPPKGNLRRLRIRAGLTREQVMKKFRRKGFRVNLTALYYLERYSEYAAELTTWYQKRIKK